MPEQLIKARVVADQYGRNFKGEIVEIEQREIDRVGHEALLPLTIEKQRLDEAAKSAPIDNHEALVARAAADGWETLRKKSEAWMAAAEAQRMRELARVLREAESTPAPSTPTKK